MDEEARVGQQYLVDVELKVDFSAAADEDDEDG